MKKVALILVSILFAFHIQADNIPESEIPDAVKKFVITRYPDARNIEWTHGRRDTSYKGVFYIDGRKMTLIVNNEGQLMFGEENLLIRELPGFVASYLEKDMPDAEIMGAVKKTRRGEETYEVEVSTINKSGNIKNQTLTFDSSGKVVKK